MRLLRYAITDWARSATDREARLALCRECARRWADEDVDFVQLREKTLPAGELLGLAEAFLAVQREAGGRTRLLVNSRLDVAVAAGADGVHLTSEAGDLTPEQVRAVFDRAGLPRPVVSMSCHLLENVSLEDVSLEDVSLEDVSLEDVSQARVAGVDLILFGPVFEKVVGGNVVAEGSGLEMLAHAVREAGETPVLALGGVTVEDGAACVEAGAAGVAGIRMFA